MTPAAHFEAASNASGLTLPKWLCRRRKEYLEVRMVVFKNQ